MLVALAAEVVGLRKATVKRVLVVALLVAPLALLLCQVQPIPSSSAVLSVLRTLLSAVQPTETLLPELFVQACPDICPRCRLCCCGDPRSVCRGLVPIVAVREEVMDMIGSGYEGSILDEGTC